MMLCIGKDVIFPQWFAGIGVTMLLIHMGLMGGWASPTLARLAAPDSTIPLDPTEASWVASLVNFSRFFGGILGAVATNFFGSKKSILITCVPVVIGWLAVVFADSVEWLYVSRFSSGLGLGMAFSTFPLYIGEVSMPEIRGALISLATVGAPFGQVIASVCGSYLTISQASSIYLALALSLTILFFWLPESPHHLVKIGKNEEAKKSINWYRRGRGVDEEFTAVQNFVAANDAQSFTDKLREFNTRPIRRATFQIMALFTFTQTSGLNVVMFFMETILTKAQFTLVNPSLIVIYVNVCGIISAGASIFLIDRCGRRFLLILSSVGTMISMICLMIHFFLIDARKDVTNLQWLPLVAVFLFMISFFMGLFPVPNAVLSETFPANIKCIAACIAILTGAVMSFVSAKTYQPIVDALGDAYVFMIYAVLSAIVIPYTLIIMSETKGKSLQQIQDQLMSK